MPSVIHITSDLLREVGLLFMLDAYYIYITANLLCCVQSNIVYVVEFLTLTMFNFTWFFVQLVKFIGIMIHVNKFCLYV